MKTIAIMNNKGGVGKTVTAVNLADILAREYGKRVVLVDCDGQMNLTRFFLPEFAPDIAPTVADLLSGQALPDWRGTLTPLEAGLALLPGSSALYDLDLQAIQRGNSRLTALRTFCQEAEVDNRVDYIIFDCPPGFTSASVAALLASDEVVLPMLLDGFSFAGMMDMWEQLRTLRQERSGLTIAGILLNQWHNSEVVRQGEELARSMEAPVFRTVIRRTDKVPESTFDRRPIVRYSPGSAAAHDYRAWVREYLGGELGNGEDV